MANEKPREIVADEIFLPLFGRVAVLMDEIPHEEALTKEEIAPIVAVQENHTSISRTRFFRCLHCGSERFHARPVGQYVCRGCGTPHRVDEGTQK